MPDIVHDFPIQASVSRVFRAVSTPAELDHWWTARSAGEPRLGAAYELWFGPEYDWRARVTRCTPDVEFELELTRSDKEWAGTKVGFDLEAKGGATQVRFHQCGVARRERALSRVVLLLGDVPAGAEALSGARRGGALRAATRCLSSLKARAPPPASGRASSLHRTHGSARAPRPRSPRRGATPPREARRTWPR